jgi:hypothetical protein
MARLRLLRAWWFVICIVLTDLDELIRGPKRWRV